MMDVKKIKPLLVIIQLSLLPIGGGCSRGLSVEQPSGSPLPTPLVAALNFESLKGRRIKDMIVAVFRDGRTREQWQAMIQRADRLSILQKRNEELSDEIVRLSESGEDTFDLDDQYSSNLSEINSIVYRLYEFDTAYLIRWTSADGCFFTTDSPPRLDCSALQTTAHNNPMNGGPPMVFEGIGAGQTLRRGRLLPQHLEIRLTSGTEVLGQFDIVLQLRPETPTLYKGEVVVADGSWFVRSGERIPHYRYGYVELRLTGE